MEIRRCRGFVTRLHRLTASPCQQNLFATLVTKASPSSSSEKTKLSRNSEDISCPVNEYGVPLIPDKLRSKLFSNVSRSKISEAATKQVSDRDYLSSLFGSVRRSRIANVCVRLFGSSLSICLELAVNLHLSGSNLKGALSALSQMSLGSLSENFSSDGRSLKSLSC